MREIRSCRLGRIPGETGVEATLAMPAGDEVGLPPDLIAATDAELIGRAAQAMPVRWRSYTSDTREWCSPSR